jgi:hypothetical protein
VRVGDDPCDRVAGAGLDVDGLRRARSFAMHAIEQADRARDHYGQRKFSLWWTGDLGLAVFLFDCTRGSCSFPTLDVF